MKEYKIIVTGVYVVLMALSIVACNSSDNSSTTTPGSGCSGGAVEAFGHCWYGAQDISCEQACANRGGIDHTAAATWNAFGGEDAVRAACNSLLDSLGFRINDPRYPMDVRNDALGENSCRAYIGAAELEDRRETTVGGDRWAAFQGYPNSPPYSPLPGSTPNFGQYGGACPCVQ